MRQLDTNLWIVDAPFKMMGAQLGNRMTVIRLSDGNVFLHSPVQFSSALKAQVSQLGNVACIVTPNNFHGLYVNEWREAFPDASYFTAKKMKANDQLARPLDALSGEQLNNEIEVIKIEGAPKVNEFAFFHKESHTLILTDLAFNFGTDMSVWSKIFFTLNDAVNKFGPSRMMRMMISDPLALRETIKKFLEFKISRIIVSHGNILEGNASEALDNAFCREC